MDLTDDEITDRIRAMATDGETQPIVAQAPITDYLSGAMQGALALGTSYLSRRIDIDLQGRLAGLQPQVSRPTNQRPVADHAAVTPQYGISGSMSSMLPWILGGLVLAGVVAAIAKRG